MCLGGLLRVNLDPLVDLVGVGTVIADGGLYEAERQLKIACRLRGVTVVIAYGRDDLPDVFAGSRWRATSRLSTQAAAYGPTPASRCWPPWTLN